MLQNLLRRIQRGSNLNDLLRQSGILYVAGVISIGFTFLQQITTANWLGASDYGRLAVVMSSGMLGMLVTDFRTWEMGSKLLSYPLANNDSLETSSVMTWLLMLEAVTGLLGMIGLILLSEPIAQYLLDAADLQGLILIYALSLPFRTLSLGIVSVFPRFYNRFDWLGAKSVMYAVVRLVLMSGAALAGFGLQGVIIGAVIGEIFNTLLLFGMYFRLWKHHMPKSSLVNFTRPKTFSSWKRLLVDLWTSSTLAGIQYHLFLPIVALFTTTMQVGVLRSGMDIAELIEKSIQPVSIVFAPRLISLYEQDKFQEFLSYLKLCAALMLGVSFTLGTGIFIVSPLLAGFLADVGFADITSIIFILTGGFTLHTALQWWLRPAMVAMNLIRIHNILMIGATAVSLFLAVTLIPEYGALGGAWAKSIYLVLFSSSCLITVLINLKWKISLLQ